MFSSLLSVHLEADLLGRVVVLCLRFLETANLFSKGTVPFYVSTTNVGESSPGELLKDSRSGPYSPEVWSGAQEFAFYKLPK